MKVLHLIKTSVGASWALRQTKELVKLGVEVHIALPAGPMVEKYQKAGVVTHELDFHLSLLKPKLLLKSLRDIRALVAEVNPDIIHSHFVLTTLLMRLALRNDETPRIFHVPGPLHLEHRFYRWLELGVSQNADHWLASCLWTRQRYIRSNIAKQRIGLAYYGVDASDFETADVNAAEDLRATLGLTPEAKLVGMVAYFYPPKAYLGQKRGLKGHEDLIDAMVEVIKAEPNAHCVLVGGPWGNSQDYMDQVKAYAAQRCPDHIHFLGFRKDVPNLYPQFEVAVHPSHSENVGGAVESMYSNVATVTSDVGGFPDLVVDGETGYMSPAKAPAQLATKIIEALSDDAERERRVKNARVKVEQVMNVKDNALQVFEFYQQILSGLQHEKAV